MQAFRKRKEKRKKKRESAAVGEVAVADATVDSAVASGSVAATVEEDDNAIANPATVDSAIDDSVAPTVTPGNIARRPDTLDLTPVRPDVPAQKIKEASASNTETDDATVNSKNDTAANSEIINNTTVTDSYDDAAIQEPFIDFNAINVTAVANTLIDSVTADDTLADVTTLPGTSDSSVTPTSRNQLDIVDNCLLTPPAAIRLEYPPTSYPRVSRRDDGRTAGQSSSQDSEQRTDQAAIHDTSASSWASNSPATAELIDFGPSTSAVESHAEAIVGDRRVSRRRRIFNWFPKMCSCVDSDPTVYQGYPSGRHRGRYHRLSTGPGIFQLSDLMHRGRRRSGEDPNDPEKQVELAFHNPDLSCTHITVEKNLRTVDLCEILKLRTNTQGDAWVVMERWMELGMERWLEDHEDILAVHREMEAFAPNHEKNFAFRLEFDKYAFFIDPGPYFPDDMLAYLGDEGLLSNIGETIKSYFIRNDYSCPLVFSLVWIRKEESGTWEKTYLVLKGRKLYTTKRPAFPSVKTVKYRMAAATKWRGTGTGTRPNMDLRDVILAPEPVTSFGPGSTYRPGTSYGPGTSSEPGPSSAPDPVMVPADTQPQESTGAVPRRQAEPEPAVVFAHLSDFYIYKTWAAKRYFDAPFEWAVCLRPSTKAEAENTDAGLPGLKIIAFSNDRTRCCWFTAMRLAKYGKQLRENYRAFKNKRDQNANGINSYNVPGENIRSRVAMDFTGSHGKIVQDPKEARDIEEGRRSGGGSWRPMMRQPPSRSMIKLHGGADGGVHVLQPWFHSDLNRNTAVAILRENGYADGVFLVRDSKSTKGAYVITYVHEKKIYHAQIVPTYDHEKRCWIFSLDRGGTRFYDLLQLIEFYQLNVGALQGKLSHYIRNNITATAQSPTDGAASPSPPSSSTHPSISPASPATLGSPTPSTSPTVRTSPTNPTSPTHRLSPTSPPTRLSPTSPPNRLSPTSPPNRLSPTSPPNRLSPTTPPNLPSRRSPTNQATTLTNLTSPTNPTGSTRYDGQPGTSDESGSTRYDGQPRTSDESGSTRYDGQPKTSDESGSTAL